MSVCTEERQKHSERVMVYSQCGISRSAAAVTAYLMYTKKWTLKVSKNPIHTSQSSTFLLQTAVDHVRQCRPQVCMQQCFINQLHQWEEQPTDDTAS